MEIKRFNLWVCIVAFSCAGLATVMYYLSDVSALITMVYLPIELVAWGLRRLSLSSQFGDIVAWILYILICLVPAMFVLNKFLNLTRLKKSRNKKNLKIKSQNSDLDDKLINTKEFKNREQNKISLTDIILLALSAYLFFMMYCFINPGMLTYILPQIIGADMSSILPMLKNVLAGVAYSLIIGFIVLKFAGSFRNVEINNRFMEDTNNQIFEIEHVKNEDRTINTVDIEKIGDMDIEKHNFKNDETKSDDIKSNEVKINNIENENKKNVEINNVNNKNKNLKTIDIWKQTERILIICTLLYVGFVCFALPLNLFEQFGKATSSDAGAVFSLTKFFLDLLPMACFVGIMESGVILIHVLKENKYSERAINTARLLAERSRRTVVVSVVCNIIQNILQLIFWHQVLNANFLLDIPFLPLILAFVGLLIAEYLKESSLLYDDNSMII